MSFHRYADDTQLYMAFNPSPTDAERCVENLENCVHDLHQWILCNNLKLLNGSKTAIMIIGSRQQHIDEATIRPKMKQ